MVIACCHYLSPFKEFCPNLHNIIMSCSKSFASPPERIFLCFARIARNRPTYRFTCFSEDRAVWTEYEAFMAGGEG